MKTRLQWIVIGAGVFWFPVLAVWALLPETLVVENVAPLIALMVVGLVSVFRKLKPRWGWMLAGIYILGPAAMMIPWQFVHRASAPSVPGETLFFIAFLLFPPMTLWMATLNGTIFSVVIATIALFVLAMAQS